MASAGDIRAGRAFVELTLRGYEKYMRGLTMARKALQNFGQGVMRIGKSFMSVGASIAAFGIGASVGLYKAVTAASDLNETLNKFNAIFGANADKSLAWAESFSKEVGRSKRETMDAMSAFGGFFTGLGIGADEAARLSQEMTSLAVDFGSFHNMQDPEAMQRFISALSGSGEVLSMYGVNIMEAALNQKLLALGFPTIAKGATETQKVMARLSIIRETMGRQGAVGDAVKTADSFANQMKAVQASVQDLAVEIGNALLPSVNTFVGYVRYVIPLVVEWVRKNAALVQMAAMVVAGITAAGAALMAMGLTLVTVGAAISAMGAAIGILLTPIGLLAAGLTAGIAAWAAWTDSGQSALGTVGRIFDETWGGIVDALSSGDIALAGEIAFQGLIVGWETVLDTLGNMWRAWSQGVVNTITSAMRSVLEVWRSATSSIANWMARDVAQMEQGRANSMNRELLAGAAKRIERGEGALAKLRGGGSLTDAEAKEFGGSSAEAINAFLADQRNQIASITGDKNSVMNIGRGAIDGTLDSIQSPIENFFDAMDASAAATPRSTAAMDEARKKLAALRQKAAKESGAIAADATKKQDAIGGAIAGGSAAMSGKSKSFATFSGAALLRAGGGGSNPVVNALKVNQELARKQLMEEKNIVKAVKAIQFQTVG